MIDLHLIVLHNTSILEQLAIEEAFLRTDHRNICIINAGTPPAIVMGISGKTDHFVDKEIWSQAPVPIIKRFSGGGTVFVDLSTLFVTWIFNFDAIGVERCPRAIHKWSEGIYQRALPATNMRLQENDYVIEGRKFGGNAQYLTKGRWLHHSSLLWDYDPRNMRYLLMPQKRPAYRENREHDAFLCKLCDYYPSLAHLKNIIISSLDESFRLHPIDPIEINSVLNRPHRRATELVPLTALSSLPDTCA